MYEPEFPAIMLELLQMLKNITMMRNKDTCSLAEYVFNIAHLTCCHLEDHASPYYLLHAQ